MSPFRSFALLLFRLLLGGVFLFAVAAKSRAPYAFADSIGAFKLLHESVLLAVALLFIWHEALCALLLILGLWTRAAALLVSAMLIVFLLALAIAWARGLDIDCGCFGALMSSRVGLASIARTLALILLALTLVHQGAGRWSLDALLKKNKKENGGLV